MRWRVRLDCGNQDFYKRKENTVPNFVNYYTWTSIKLTEHASEEIRYVAF
uniref:Uncharacterized protein n=1 Tax=Anguilla anguilla TaxID=7936 RepID=A0A0E9T9C6_ANGAN